MKKRTFLIMYAAAFFAALALGEKNAAAEQAGGYLENRLTEGDLEKEKIIIALKESARPDYGAEISGAKAAGSQGRENAAPSGYEREKFNSGGGPAANENNIRPVNYEPEKNESAGSYALRAAENGPAPSAETETYRKARPAAAESGRGDKRDHWRKFGGNADDVPGRARLYIGARGILDALKVAAPAEKTDRMNNTTMLGGVGLSVGTYKRVGYAALRFEIDYSYVMKANNFYHAVMLDVYVESAHDGFPFYPYVMAGVGINIFDPSFSPIESDAAFNVGAGVDIPLKGPWSLDVGFRYMQANIDYHIGEGHVPTKNHNFYAGVRYAY